MREDFVDVPCARNYPFIDPFRTEEPAEELPPDPRPHEELDLAREKLGATQSSLLCSGSDSRNETARHPQVMSAVREACVSILLSVMPESYLPGRLCATVY